ncbi:ABC transporter permease [Chloroflexi bacterium TSY]|nr:ABC transporter permease [Chloroflexi bacterium TSY]
MSTITLRTSNVTTLSQNLQLERKPETFLNMALRALRKDRLTLAAIFIVIVLGLCTLFASLLTNQLVGVDPNKTNTDYTFGQPYIGPYIKWRLGIDPVTAPVILGKTNGVTHWLGTDRLGRDQMARLLYGGRVSLGIAFSAAIISLVLGVLVGTVAGYFGGIGDDLIMWVINTISAVPTIYLLIIVSSIYKPSPETLTLFLGFLGWLGTARFMRGNVFKVKELDYVTAARSIGASNLCIMVQHIIPNSIAVIIVITAIGIGGLILAESVLSFLGLGVQAPTATWGNMLSRTRSFFFLIDPETGAFTALHLMLPPGILISLAVLCFYLIGDGLRDALDPTLKNKR